MIDGDYQKNQWPEFAYSQNLPNIQDYRGVTKKLGITKNLGISR
jgi:hypothetical protein